MLQDRIRGSLIGGAIGDALGYPVEFIYLTDYTAACTGWHAAVKFMKYTDAEAKIINPSKLGFSSAEGTTVTPYGYEMKIKIKRY